MANEAISFYEPGTNLTGVATATVVGKTFLAISGNRSTASATAGNVSVATATAAGRTCGVAQADAASGELVGVLRGNSRVVPVTAGGTIAAFAEVEVGTGGKAVTKASGVAVGYAVTGATNGTDAQISLY